MDLSAFESQVKMALGEFIVEKKNDKIIIHDDYDFPASRLLEDVFQPKTLAITSKLVLRT